MAFIVVLEF